MADRTTIEWTDATWNPVTGCTRVDEGCRNCYAEIMAARFSGPGQWGEGLARVVKVNGKAADHRWTGTMKLRDRTLGQPLRWKKPRRIFVNSTSDMFHDSVPDEWIDRVFEVMARCPQHIFQILTKRPARMRDYMTAAHAQVPRRNIGHSMIWPNVWLGTSVSDQASAEARIPALLETPAAVHFLSAEPLLGTVSLRCIPFGKSDRGFVSALTGQTQHPETRARHPDRHPDIARLKWVIAGGESGPGARPMHPDWARYLRDQCVAAGVAFFFKQWGEHAWAEQVEGDPNTLTAHRIGKKAAGRLLDGRTWDEMPGVEK